MSHFSPPKSLFTIHKRILRRLYALLGKWKLTGDRATIKNRFLSKKILCESRYLILCQYNHPTDQSSYAKLARNSAKTDLWVWAMAYLTDMTASSIQAQERKEKSAAHFSICKSNFNACDMLIFGTKSQLLREHFSFVKLSFETFFLPGHFNLQA